MRNYPFTGTLKILIGKAIRGTSQDINDIMENLTDQSDLAMTRYVDYALSLVQNPQGIKQIEWYLFHGSLIQRNYASLYFNRLGDWKIVKQAYDQGLIDEIQAYAR